MAKLDEKSTTPLVWLLAVIVCIGGFVVNAATNRLDGLEKRVDDRYEILIQIKEDVAVIKNIMEHKEKTHGR